MGIFEMPALKVRIKKGIKRKIMFFLELMSFKVKEQC